MAEPQVSGTFWSELGRNGRLVVAARALRTFGYGTTSVLLAEMLTQDGDTPWQAGLLLAVAAAGSVAASLALGLFADAWGRRRVLMACGCLMAVAGVLFAVSESYPVLIAAAFVGTISPSTNDNTPFSGVEQAILAQTCGPSCRTRVFTCYNVTAMAAGALGGLAAAGLGAQPWVSAGDAAFALYAVLAIGTVLLFARLTPDAEARPAASPADRPKVPAAEATPPGVRVPGHIRRLAGLFALDAFAGGLAVQAVLAWWFAHRYGAGTPQLGMMFFAANLLPALAQLTAPLLAARRGLLAAMLLPHAAANVLLACVPLAPTLGGAVTLLLLRQTLSKIDVPARQAFTAAVFAPQHRTAAASMTSLARSVAVAAGPLAATAMLTGPLAVLGAPLLLGAALGLGYDITVWRSYRTVHLTTG
ncbi:MFS transporter [Actinomadura parmotrematis]|uniref:MFS transporter n=1 Tax=Actinomadura parmotrematis TaxID=2864039 RepID=A0ABS7FXN9_9ACTN|nr:MFS transporter [Actinomadura parmotrematis]MBW8485194.1 MFS transporter [Actinomadura parmotrematis]